MSRLLMISFFQHIDFPSLSFILFYFCLKIKIKTSRDLGDLRFQDLNPRTDSMKS